MKRLPQNYPRGGFVERMIRYGFVSVFVSLFLFYSVCYLYVFGYTTMLYHGQEKILISEAAARYKINCETKDAYHARIFKEQCARDREKMHQQPFLEALNRIARKNQLCGEDGCAYGFLYLFLIIIGFGFCGICLMKLQSLIDWMVFYLQTYNDPIGN